VLKVKRGTTRLQPRLLRLTPKFVYHIEKNVGVIKQQEEKVRKWVSWPEVVYISVRNGERYLPEGIEIHVVFLNQNPQR
jgi:hypothetical protein